jgi:hypothetical protein
MSRRLRDEPLALIEGSPSSLCERHGSTAAGDQIHRRLDAWRRGAHSRDRVHRCGRDGNRDDPARIVQLEKVILSASARNETLEIANRDQKEQIERLKLQLRPQEGQWG